jgi:hypothetical protein
MNVTKEKKVLGEPRGPRGSGLLELTRPLRGTGDFRMEGDMYNE